jgi:cytochrome P450
VDVSKSTPTRVPDVSTEAFWSRPAAERASTWAELRRRAPVSFQNPPDFGQVQSRRGFWAVARHADVQFVSRNPELFCSGQGVGMGQVSAEVMELNASFLVMDAPRHTKLRRVVSGAFTPKQVARLNQAIASEAIRIVDEFVDRGGGEAVHELAMKLPLWTISAMLGVPESMHPEMYEAAEIFLAAQDPEFVPPGGDMSMVMRDAALTMHRIAAELIAARRSQPSDDVLSTLVHSQLDGEPLNDQILGGVFVLLATAGNDTTRNTTSHALRLFSDHPDQWTRVCEESALLPSALEEVLRYATPVIHFRRTTTAATELVGVPMAEGDAVVLFYESANRDETVFPDPDRFDISRQPNPHVAFGGGGQHFCLGASLARAQLRAIFSRLAERVIAIEADPPDYLTSNFVNGIKRMPVALATG